MTLPTALGPTGHGPPTTLPSFGVEEEYMLLHPETLGPVNAGAAVRDRLISEQPAAEVPSANTEFQTEFLACQLEFASPIFTDRDEALRTLQRTRCRIAIAAAEFDAIVGSVGTPPYRPEHLALSEGDRYHELHSRAQRVATDHLINGLHIHVGIAGDEDGIHAMNLSRLWLPVLVALSANSPLWDGADTGFASWRTIHSRRWTTAGCPPAFQGAPDYHRRTRQLLDLGLTTDLDGLAWYLRLSRRHPTVEFRFGDAQLEAADSVALALLCRALIHTSLTDPSLLRAPEMPAEVLDAALWHAARFGVSGTLLHPTLARLAPASQVIAGLLKASAQALGPDYGFVARRVQRILERGPGAVQQRAAFLQGGISELRELLLQTFTAQPNNGDPHV